MLGLEKLTEYVQERRDPRLESWPLATSSPLPTISLIIAFLLTVKVFLPAYMKNRPAYNLKKVMFYYNLFQVIYSVYLVYLSFFSGYASGRYPIWGCRDVERNPNDPDASMAARGVYLYYIAKYTEFLDTIFFVLRKKHSQVSFLHVYHHASMPLNGWLGCVFAPGGSALMVAGTNSAIHVPMYAYYLLAGLGPRWQRYLWWKPYLTRFQIIQFIYGIAQCVVTISTLHRCPNIYSCKNILIYFSCYVLSLLYLFIRFYLEAYKKSKTKSAKKMK